MGRAAAGLALALAASLIGGCGPDCAPSADIQVTLVPSPAVDGTQVTRLRVGLSVDGGPTHVLEFAPPHALTQPSSFVLHPDSPPTGGYNVAVTVEAFNAGGALVEVGGASSDVVPSGCNRLEARLAPLPGGGDGGETSDAAPAIDLLPMPPDLSCFGPDEDGDGRPNSCDLCPDDADPNPVDSDVDGLPDACDPDPTRAGNHLVYFEPFDNATGHWSGTFSVQNSELIIQTQGTTVSSNGLDVLPAGVRVQSHMLAAGVFGMPATTVADMGLFIGSGPNPSAPSASGMLCTINHNPNGDTLDLNVIANGQVQLPPIDSRTYAFGTGIVYRMRFSQLGQSYVCEAVTNGFPMTTAMARVTTAAPVAPQYVALHGTNVDVRFHSVVAETVLP